MDLFELLLRLKERTGDQTFQDALTELAHIPSPPPPERLVRERASGSKKLPRNFICGFGHLHLVSSLEQLVSHGTPRCLLIRIVLEWAVDDVVDDAR